MKAVSEPEFHAGSLPPLRQTSGDLYLRFPAAVTARKARSVLETTGRVVQEDDDLILSVRNADAPPILKALSASLTSSERAKTFAMIKPSGSQFRSIDGLYAVPLDELRNRFAGNWLIELLRDNRIFCYFQPVVHAKSTDVIFAYEALARARRDDGELITGQRMVEVARGANIMTQFDQKAIQVAMTSAAAAKLTGALFLNCAPANIYDPQATLDFMLELCKKTGIAPNRIIFEIIEVEKIDADDILPIIRLFQKQGFRIALDDLGSGYSSLGVLSMIRPDFLKIDRSLVTGITKDPYKALVLSNLLESTRILGTPTVVEGIETQEEYDWATTNGATYLQGFFFAKPQDLTPKV
jgi:EAL domain-containing protein (putative c-di-GMP-specific phosphodiesterase class I)